jgi:hypothetical protein
VSAHDIPKLALTADDLKRLRVGDIRKATAEDGTPMLVVTDTSPNRGNITWPFRVVLSAAELDLIEADPQAGQIVKVEGQLFHVVGERS